VEEVFTTGCPFPSSKDFVASGPRQRHCVTLLPMIHIDRHYNIYEYTTYRMVILLSCLFVFNYFNGGFRLDVRDAFHARAWEDDCSATAITQICVLDEEGTRFVSDVRND